MVLQTSLPSNVLFSNTVWPNCSYLIFLHFQNFLVLIVGSSECNKNSATPFSVIEITELISVSNGSSIFKADCFDTFLYWIKHPMPEIRKAALETLLLKNFEKKIQQCQI